ncbi:hypothetical protein K461DRAFT_295678 [Myriangium duriaei CBS 260.36]|uniref:Uncharacterized protein n=1 Tax=Myriangium duriaei CBS 260.36 TaxID=1168546 RepID=A0A9P4J0X8_9PEZI|nr:hypothetical protein K461DRAFT_295678 [Myriangium duriaei CBS 260.36]
MGNSSSKHSNQCSLYVAIFDGGNRRPHVGLIVDITGDNTFDGMLYHANKDQGDEDWAVECRKLQKQPSSKFMVRIVIGEVRNLQRLIMVLFETPGPSKDDIAPLDRRQTI